MAYGNGIIANVLQLYLVADFENKNFKFRTNFQFNNKIMNEEQNINEPQNPAFLQTAVSCWVAFDWNKIETHPTEYGKYLICRKDGKIHWETWNGSGWAYNHNEIRFWAVIVPPCR